MTVPVFGITGWKNSGKTTLATRLVTELVARGLRVSSVKHAHHEAEVDVPGSDSFRHREAGASEVALVTSRRWALMHELRDEPEPTLADILARMAPVDLVIVEGFKREAHPKIECRRTAARDQTPMDAAVYGIVAVAADHVTDAGSLPSFHLDDVGAVADFVAKRLDLKR